jgi:OPT oligopeptide transporter protein
VGLYLPIATSAGIGIGGGVRWLVDRKRKGTETESEAEFSPGMLMASGLIAGGSIAAVVQAALMTFEVDSIFNLGKYLPSWLVGNMTWWPLFWFLAMGYTLYVIGIRKKLPEAVAREK